MSEEEKTTLSMDKPSVFFRPITKDFLSAIKRQMAAEAIKRSWGSINHQKSEIKACADDQTLPDPKLEEGMPLPAPLAKALHPDLVNIPLEDIDPFYSRIQTFVVVTKRMIIFRFSATDAMWFLSPFNPIRRVALATLTHDLLYFVTLTTILFNCVVMTIPSSPYTDMAEVAFTIIYIFESAVKITARGFILEKFTYLRDVWNWLDFITTIYLANGTDLRSLASVRAFRVLRIFTILRGLKTIVRAVARSVRNHRDVISFVMFVLFVFGLIGLNLYQGVLTQKCIQNFPEDGSKYQIRDANWAKWNRNATHWHPHPLPDRYGEADYTLCGNSSWARQCPNGYTCLQGFGKSPNYGYASFDSFIWAFISVFRLMTQDFWERLYQQILLTAGLWHVFFFVIAIFLGSFYLENLLLAMLAMSYEELQRKELIEENSAASENAAEEVLKAENDPKKGTDIEEFANQKLLGRCFRCVDLFCSWNCCAYWSWLQKIIALIIFDPFTELFITLAIIANLIFLALDHHGLEQNRTLFWVLHTGNHVFATIFAVECAMKLIAMSPKLYFKIGWNILDFVVVALSLVELSFQDTNLSNLPWISALRILRVLRAFKLANAWPTMNLLIAIIGKTMGAMWNLVLASFMTIFIFAVTGIHLFAKSYWDKWHLFPGRQLPRWNFIDFWHSFLSIFRVLCGEWSELFWDCTLVAGWVCVPFFLAAVAICNLVALNLFLAVLLSSFGATDLGSNSDPETNNLAKAFQRIRTFMSWILKKLFQCLRGVVNLNRKSQILPEPTKSDQLTNNLEKLQEQSHQQDKHGTEKGEIRATSVPATSHGSLCGRKWANIRSRLSTEIERKYFRAAYMVVIVLSSLALALEDIHLPQNPQLAHILSQMELIFTAIFIFEMLLKWLALGLFAYFTDGWCLLDFTVVVISIFNSALILAQVASKETFKAVRALRALRPLQVISRMSGLRSVVGALVQAIPKIFSVLLVCLTFWLIFAVMGVQLFNGKFYKCIDPQDQTRVDPRIVRNKSECLDYNLTWVNSAMNFDHVGNAYLCLFQVATFKGWISIINDAVDSREIDEQPYREANFKMYVYFIAFIIIGSFFTLNLFVGVIIGNFNEQRKITANCCPRENFLTENQRKYHAAIKNLEKRKPTRAIPKPSWRPRAILFGNVTNKKFDVVIMLLTILNVVAMTLAHFPMSLAWEAFLNMINGIFYAVFTVECIVKMFALGNYYFRDPWNIFDLVVVFFSILESLLAILGNYFYDSLFSSRLLNLVKIGRVFRLVKGMKGIRTLLFALVMSLPELFNICLLLFVVMAVYSIFGMSFFMHVKLSGGLDDVRNFQTFGHSIIFLFQISTSAGWDGVLVGITNEENCIPSNSELGTFGNCGDRVIRIIFLLSYLVISYLIIIKMYIAVVIEQCSQVAAEGNEGLTDNEYDMYYEIWTHFDPQGTNYIRYDQLFDFIDMLEPPFRIQKPNKFKIILLDIPICKGDKLHCVDILGALAKGFFIRKWNITGEVGVGASEFQITPDGPMYEPISSTFRRQRKEVCARLIQNTWRKHRKSEAKGQEIVGVEEKNSCSPVSLDENVESEARKKTSSTLCRVMMQIPSSIIKCFLGFAFMLSLFIAFGSYYDYTWFLKIS